MMKNIGLLLMSTIILLTACSHNKNIVKLNIASEKRTAMGIGPMDVLLVKEGDEAEWTFFYSNIEGFNYEPGYEYILKVKKEALQEPIPADASSIKYILIKEMSKIRKTSEDMPKNVVNK